MTLYMMTRTAPEQAKAEALEAETKHSLSRHLFYKYCTIQTDKRRTQILVGLLVINSGLLSSTQLEEKRDKAKEIERDRAKEIERDKAKTS